MELMDFALKQEANEEIEDILCVVQCVSVCGQYILDATTIHYFLCIRVCIHVFMYCGTCVKQRKQYIIGRTESALHRGAEPITGQE